MVSIIIATYNSGKTLGKCLESVLQQRLHDWECIIIDGCSKDNTISILEDYKNRDSRFRYISEPDKGIYDALNKGIKLASGKWLYVLGSDDWLTERGLSDLVEKAASESDIVYGNIIDAYPNGTFKVIKPKPLRYFKYFMPLSHQGVIVSLSEVKNTGGFDLRYHVMSDYNMLQTFFLKGLVFQYVDTSIEYSGMEGLSNRLDAKIRYDWERFLINSRNKANRIPFISWLVIELRIIGYTLRDALSGRNKK